MSGPWDKYAPPSDSGPWQKFQAPATASGPWDKFGAQPVATGQLVVPQATTPDQGPQLVADTGQFREATPSEQAAVDTLTAKKDFAALPTEEKIVQKVKQDFTRSLTPALISAGAKAVGLPQLALPELSGTEKAADLGLAGNLAVGGAALAADPGATALLGGLGKAATKIPGVGKLFDTAGDLAFQRQAAALELKSVGDVADAAFSRASRQYVLNRIAQGAVKGGVEFGGLNAATESANQLNDQKFDPLAITTQMLQGMGFGSVLGGLAGGLTTDRAQLFNASRKAIVESKLQALEDAKVQPKVGDQLDAQIADFQSQKTDLSKQLDESYGKLQADQKAQLQQKVQSLDEQITNAKTARASLVAPEGPSVPGVPEDQAIIQSASGQRPITSGEYDASKAGIEKAAQRAATIQSQLDELTASQTGAQKQIAQIQADPYGIGFNNLDKLKAQAEKQGAKIDALTSQLQSVSDDAATHMDRLQTGKRAVTEGEGRDLTALLEQQRASQAAGKEQNWLDYHLQTETANRKLEELLRQRETLARGLDSPFVGVNGERVGNLQNQIADLDSQISGAAAAKSDVLRAYKSFVQDSGPLSLKNRVGQGWETRPQYIDKSYGFSGAASQLLVDRGVIKPEQKAGFQTQMFQELLQKRGLSTASGESSMPKSETLRGFIQKAELMNLADKKLGTRLVDSYYELLQGATKLDHWKVEESANGHALLNTLQAKGLPPEEITRLMQYVERTETGIPYFNPNAVESQALTRPAYSGAVPADKVLTVYPELAAWRQEFDRVKSLATENGRREIGDVNGYIKIMPKRGAVSAPNTANALDAVESPSQYRERFGGQWDPSVHESDPHAIWQSYVNGVMRDRAFSPILPFIQSQMFKTLALGDSTAATEFGRVVSRAMGIDTDKALSAQFAQQIAYANEPQIRAMLAAAGDTRGSAFDETVKVLKQAMYESQVFLKAKLYLLHVLQPNFIGAAEVGNRWINAANLELAKSAESRAFVKQFRQELLGAEPSVLEDLGIGGLQNPIAKGASKLVSLPSKVTGAKAAFNAIEHFKRESVFLAGYRQFQDAVKQGPTGIDGALDGLLEGERSRVQRLLSQSGPEAAAQAYGIIRSYRANFALSAINKPELLADGLGRLIPFTTWGTNQLARSVTDATRVFSGNAPQLARRIAYPMIGLSLIRGITGQDVPNGHPMSDLTHAASFNVAPMITEPLQQLSRGNPQGAAQAFAHNLPGIAQFEQYKKKFAETGSRTSALLGTNPVYGTPAQRALPQVLRKVLKQ